MKYFFYVCISVLLLLSACCDCPPAKKVGDKKLISTSLSSLGFYDEFQYVIFRNNNGFVAEFRFDTLRTGNDVLDTLCCGNLDCGFSCQYFDMETRQGVLQGTSLPLHFDTKLSKYAYPIVKKIDPQYDILAITLNQLTLVMTVPFDSAQTAQYYRETYPFSENVLLHPVQYDSLTLNNLTYYNVKGIENGAAQNTEIKSLYFTDNQGVVGYILANNETWNKQ